VNRIEKKAPLSMFQLEHLSRNPNLLVRAVSEQRLVGRGLACKIWHSDMKLGRGVVRNLCYHESLHKCSVQRGFLNMEGQNNVSR
jgi:hypothetical protein